MKRLGRACAFAPILLLSLAVTLWAFGALYYVFPWAILRAPIALVYALAAMTVGAIVRPARRAITFVFAAFGVGLAWWFSLSPSNDRAWEPDVAQTGFAEIEGDTVVLHNVRNCDYRSETDYTARWETRSLKLSHLSGMDCILTYWGSPWIAHPIISFRFEDAPPIAFSIEVRKEVGEEYSSLAGFFRRYELIYIMADERDVVRVRTNYRTGEESYLYKLNASPARAREIFLDYLRSLNALHTRPEFYNALTSNCTTNIRIHVAGTAHERARPWNWRILLNGKIDEYAYAIGALNRALPFPELKRRSLINPIARTVDPAPDFSARIRAGLPGEH